MGNCREPQDRETINQTVDGFADYSATALVNITHNQDPWNEAYEEGMNRIISKKAIKEYFESDDNTIMVHISNLRDKIEDNPKNPRYIKTIRGVGYKIEDR